MISKWNYWVLAGLAGSVMWTAAAGGALAPQGRKAGWRLLFDGKTTRGWRSADGGEFPRRGWKVEDGCLKHLLQAGGGDIVTEDVFWEFDFRFEWKINAGGNSGVKYFVVPERGRHIGHEYQLLGEKVSGPAARRPSLAGTASFYVVVPTVPNRPLRPAGEWNQGRILVTGNHVEHWLNGKKAVEYELGSPKVLAAVARSKFRNVKDFGKKVCGHILLQDHGGEVWFRNLKILELAPCPKKR